MAELVIGIDTSEKLPDGYTRLEYLRSVNGAQWIVDSTLTTMTSGSYEIKVSNLTQLCRFVGFCQGAETTAGNAYTTQCCIATSNYIPDRTDTYFPINYYNNGWDDTSQNKVNIIQENILKYEFRQGEQKLYVNGVLNKTATQSNPPSGSYPFRLFKVGDSVSPVSFTGSSSIHHCKVYDANGELIRNYIPCKNSSNVYGMYELVTGNFFVNRGSGTFTAGPEYTPNIQYARVPALVVEKGAPIKKYNLYDRIKDDSNNDIGIVTGFFTKKVEGHNLPSEYTELEYIESTGTQYIDTGINYQSTDTFELDFMVTDLSSSKHVVTNNRVDQTDAFFQIAQTSTLLLADINNDGSGTDIGRVSTNQITSLNNRIKVYIPDGKTVYMNNTLIGTAPNPLNTNSNTLRLFGSYISAESNIRIYSLKVGNKAYFIPAKRKSDSVLGMYDLASGTFFINSGSGTFTAGPYVIPENTEYAIVCLNAQYRIENNNSNATYCTGTVSNQKYYTTIEDVWNTTDTATEINDALYTEKSTDAVAINYLRTNFSFTIEGNVYKPQVPNIPELYSILNNFTVINNGDPTASSYPTKTLKTGTELGAVLPSFPESQYGYRSCQFVNNWQTISYWACGFIANQGISRKNGPSSGSNVYAFVVPVLELPNQIIG